METTIIGVVPEEVLVELVEVVEMVEMVDLVEAEAQEHKMVLVVLAEAQRLIQV